METPRFFTNTLTSLTKTTLIEISFVILFPSLGVAQNLPAKEPDVRQVTEQIVDGFTAQLNEERFWDLLPVPARGSRVLVFKAAEAMQKSADQNFNVLAIFPDTNTTIKYRLSDGCLESQDWPGSPSKNIPADEYVKLQKSAYADFISRAVEFEGYMKLEPSPDPATLFRVDSELKSKRIKQIKGTIKNYIHKKDYKITIASFSMYTTQINVLIPATREMFTMSVLHLGCPEESVALGRILPVKSIKPDLLQKIEANSTSMEIQ